MAVWEVGDHFIFQEKDLKWNMPIYPGRPSLHMQFIGLMYNKSILDWSNVHKQLPLKKIGLVHNDELIFKSLLKEVLSANSKSFEYKYKYF